MPQAWRPSERAPGPRARIALLGPFRLTDAAGRDRTPRSAHQQALLAVVALASDAGVARARLMDLFWGDKTPQLAAQSLRTALHGLRRGLDTLGAPLLEIDAHRVRLVPGAATVDLLDLAAGDGGLPAHLRADPPDVLEGVNIPAEPFEEWLREQRQHWYDRIEALRDAPAPAVTAVRPAAPPAFVEDRPIVGLLEPVIHSRSYQALFLGEALVDRIAFGLRDYVGARTYDYRDLTTGPDHEAVTRSSPSLYLRLRLYEADGALSIRILVLRHSAQELLWSVQGGPYRLDSASIDSAEILVLLGEAIERVAMTLARDAGSDPDGPLTPFHVLTAMFQINHASLSDLRRGLQSSRALTQDPVYAALQAYLNTFRVGEHWTAQDAPLAEETRALVAQVEDSQTGGIALALAGHATGYILHDHDHANALLDRAIRTAPHSAVCWDHMALHHIYNGRYADARRASQNALRIGEHSPIRFTLDLTRCMIATLEGDFGTASALGRRILTRRPNYGAALRYTSVSLAHLGDTVGAKDCIQRIRRMDPDFSVAWVNEDRMAVRDGQAKAILTEGLIMAGAK
ncbi:hypothetical protein SAMN05444339_10863 [Loktanella atrilutea]|uniref:DNA-binding transcriptional activator of the SARP family n=1 Tax=Loktanella atrilutea TaxID=366533 RepID=A0A1M5CRB5_LOKAT|nr:hypothetical protein SAMN05444339_10863 [Loktanella atrilutea]